MSQNANDKPAPCERLARIRSISWRLPPFARQRNIRRGALNCCRIEKRLMFENLALSNAPPDCALEGNWPGVTAFPYDRQVFDNGIENTPYDRAALDDFHGPEAPKAVIGGDRSQQFRNADASNMRSPKAKSWSRFARRRFPDHVGVERIKERTEIGLLEARRHTPH